GRGGRGGDRGGDDLALHQQALAAGVNETGAELGERENPDNKCKEPGEGEEDDAPRQARRALPQGELPGTPGGAVAGVSALRVVLGRAVHLGIGDLWGLLKHDRSAELPAP